MTAFIQRNPFARETVVRRSVNACGSTCHWCGQTRKGGRLFQYGMQHDSGRDSWDDRLFCCKGCHDSYHD